METKMIPIPKSLLMMDISVKGSKSMQQNHRYRLIYFMHFSSLAETSCLHHPQCNSTSNSSVRDLGVLS